MKQRLGYWLALALGVFLGNWLVVPLFFDNRTHKDGLIVGLIAAILVLVFYGLIFVVMKIVFLVRKKHKHFLD